MKYAPIIIPTLNRYEHFKECIESLSNCTGAEYTEVYVGLDFPAKEAHWEGYKKIKRYLESCGNLNFKKIHVLERPFNYGIRATAEHPSNFGDLTNLMESEYEAYIATEDDNIFSPNFLIYINKGLERFKDDKTIVAICGYRHPYNLKFNTSSYFKEDVYFSAWGYGIWTDRRKELEKINYHFFKKAIFSKRLFYIIHSGFRRASQLFYYSSSRCQEYLTDNYISVVMEVLGKKAIMPSKLSLVRTSMDDTGTSFGSKGNNVRDIFNHQQISDERDFEYVGDGLDNYEYNRKVLINEDIDRVKFAGFAKAVIKFIGRTILNR